MPQRRTPPGNHPQHQDRFRLILQNVRDFAIFSADIEGRINEWNPGAERFFGYTEQEVLGQHMELLYVPEDRAAGQAELEKAQAAQTGFSEDERWHLRKDGTRFFVSGVVNAMYDDQRKLCGFIKVARDITPRKRLQEQLEASEAKHRLILEAIKDFAIISLDLQGNIRTWNPGAALTFGYSEAEVLGKNHDLLFTPEDQAKGEPRRRLVEAVRQGVCHGEGWLVRKDGGKVFAIDVLRPMMNDWGHPDGVLKVSRDITNRHMTRLKLEATQRELENIRAGLEQKVAHRTAALEQTIQSLELVLYHVAHDLRGPLRTMEGFSSILVQKYASAPDEEAEHLTAMISSSARRMDQLIRDLLTYGRLCHEPVTRQKVSLRVLVDETLRKLSAEVTRAGAIVQVDDALPWVWADPQVFVQVLCHLLNNALTFVAVGVKPKIHLWAERKDKFIRLWIEDNGIGIAPEYLDRIFWLFEQLGRGNGASTGMGLPIARKGIERMDGRIGVESRQANGSCFWIELPAVIETV